MPFNMLQAALPELRRMTVIRLRLTAEQTSQLSPLVLEASARHENVIFIAVTVPSWSQQDNATVWQLQATSFRARLGQKLQKLIRNGSK
jgi:hypothetical protein